jgi:hypothetical protein
MSKLSNAGGDAAIKAAVGIAPAGNRYLALCTDAPTDSAVGTELATPGTSGYTRPLVAFAAPVDHAGARECVNSGSVVVGPLTAALGVVTHVMLMDDAALDTAAHMLAWAALDTARTPAIGDSVDFAPGDLSWEVN